MALVTKEAQALESRLEWDLAAKCSNYQQLLIMKKNQGNEQGIQNATSCAGMTPSERLICTEPTSLRWNWMRRDVPSRATIGSCCLLGAFVQLRRRTRSGREGPLPGLKLLCGTELEDARWRMPRDSGTLEHGSNIT